MSAVDEAEAVLDEILGKLGFSYSIEQQEGEEGSILQIRTEQGKYLIGKSGDRLKPLNAYYRRIAHNAVVDDPEIETVSPRGDDRMKRITLKLAGS